MNRRTHTWKLLRCGAVAAAALVAGLLFGQRGAHAQSLTLDFTINSDINSPVTNMNLTSGSSNTTVTVDVWAVVNGGATTLPSSDLGLLNMYFGARSSVTNSGAFVPGTASSSGANANVGLTAGTFQSPFNSTSSFDGNFGDRNSDGVNDISTLTSFTSTAVANANSSPNDEFGGTAGNGEAVGTNSWAWEIATMTFTIGTVRSQTSSAQITTLTPSAPTFTTTAQDQWTITGTTAGNVSNKTSAADALQIGSPVTFTVAASGGGGNASVLSLAPTTNSLGVLQNGTAPAMANEVLSETSGANSATYTGATTGNFSVGPTTITNGGSSGTGAAGTVAASGSLTLPTLYTGSTTTNGTFTGTYTVTNTSGSTATQGNLASSLSVVVGNATDDTSGSGSFTGSVLQGVVGNGGSYGTTTSPLSSSSNGGTKAANPTSGQPGIEGSTASILLGTNNQGGPVTVSMTWRTRALNETPHNDATVAGNSGVFTVNGTPTAPPLPNGSQNPLPLISDVVNLFGMSAASTGVNPGTTAPVQVDPFAFEMSYNPATLNAEGAPGNKGASHGQLYLASLIPFTINGNGTASVASTGGTPFWANTITGDFAVAGGSTATYKMGPNNNSVTIQIGSSASLAMGGNFNLPLLESFSTFMTSDSVTAANLANFVGAWGVDTTNDEAWAVIDHNSEFAVVPEPSGIVLAIFGLAGLGLAASKRKKLAA